MNQNFDFTNSNQKLDNKSKIIDNNSANIENQNFHIHISINKRIFALIVSILFLFVALYIYQSYEKYKDKKAKEETIRVLIEEKNSIMNQTFDRGKAKEDIKKIIE